MAIFRRPLSTICGVDRHTPHGDWVDEREGICNVLEYKVSITDLRRLGRGWGGSGERVEVQGHTTHMDHIGLCGLLTQGQNVVVEIPDAVAGEVKKSSSRVGIKTFAVPKNASSCVVALRGRVV